MVFLFAFNRGFLSCQAIAENNPCRDRTPNAGVQAIQLNADALLFLLSLSVWQADLFLQIARVNFQHIGHFIGVRLFNSEHRRPRIASITDCRTSIVVLIMCPYTEAVCTLSYRHSFRARQVIASGMPDMISARLMRARQRHVECVESISVGSLEHLSLARRTTA